MMVFGTPLTSSSGGAAGCLASRRTPVTATLPLAPIHTLGGCAVSSSSSSSGESTWNVGSAASAAAAAALAASRYRERCSRRRSRHGTFARLIWGTASSRDRGLTGLRGLAPWLSDSKNLEEARGLRKPAPPAEPTVRGHDKPPMQGSFRERIRMIKPYRDVADQIEKNFHGKGGLRRKSVSDARVRKPGEKKPAPLTKVDKLANSLATTRCTQVARSKLTTPNDWPKPSDSFPEVCFVGRSNVGKSSLLNKVSMFGTVAAVSAMPGRTKHVSWYRNHKVGMDVIDMPGYGHSDRARVFGPSALEFVRQRTSIRVLYVLIDARHGFKRSDHEWLGELGKDGPLKQVILTKCDLVGPKTLVKVASLARSDLEGFKRVEQKVLLCSTVTGAGLHDIRCDMLRHCGRDPSMEVVASTDVDAPRNRLTLPGVTDRNLDARSRGGSPGKRGLSLPGVTDRDNGDRRSGRVRR